jgi:hypothetical protein
MIRPSGRGRAGILVYGPWSYLILSDDRLWSTPHHYHIERGNKTNVKERFCATSRVLWARRQSARSDSAATQVGRNHRVNAPQRYECVPPPLAIACRLLSKDITESEREVCTVRVRSRTNRSAEIRCQVVTYVGTQFEMIAEQEIDATTDTSPENGL